MGFIANRAIIYDLPRALSRVLADGIITRSDKITIVERSRIRGVAADVTRRFVGRSGTAKVKRKRTGSSRGEEEEGDRLFTATYRSAMPCAEEEDEVGQEAAWKRKTDEGQGRSDQ